MISELDDLLEDLGVDDDARPTRKKSTEEKGSVDSGSSGGSPLNKWRIKTRGLMSKVRAKREQERQEDDEDNPLGNKADVRSVLGGAFSLKKIAGWSSPSRTNKSDLRRVEEIIENLISSTRAELSTEAVMQAVQKELGQLFKPSTWSDWFADKIDDIYDKRDTPNGDFSGGKSSGINKSTNLSAQRGRTRRQFDDSDEDTLTDDDSEDEDAPIRSRNGSRRGSPSAAGASRGSRSPNRREIIDDDTESEDDGQGLASSPFSAFTIGGFATVLPSGDASSVSRDVRKARKIKTQIWGGMQDKYGDQTGRVIGRNEGEMLVKLQFPQADLWFAYEALDLCTDNNMIRRTTHALRQANAKTPDQPRRGDKPDFEGAANKLFQKAQGRRNLQEDDGDSDDDMRQHFQDTTEQVEEVTVTFEDGPLGMGFGWDGEFLEVFKFNLDAQGRKGQAEASESIMVGDLLVAVNDRPLSGLSKIEVIDILKTTRRPMDCTFRGIPAQ